MLKNHLIQRVVCSSVIGTEAHTTNALNQLVNLTKDEDAKLYVNGVQIISYDIMATNGVLYIIDDVMIPDEGKLWLLSHMSFSFFFIAMQTQFSDLDLVLPCLQTFTQVASSKIFKNTQS